MVERVPGVHHSAREYGILVLSVTHGNPSLEEISLSDEQFWPIYPSLAEIPPVTDSTSDVCRDPSLREIIGTVR